MDMRIDQGPTLEEIRESVRTGKVLRFTTVHGEEMRGVAVSARIDHQSGRVMLVLEEAATGMLAFARYLRRGQRWSCGDIVLWRVGRSQVEELRREAS